MIKYRTVLRGPKHEAQFQKEGYVSLSYMDMKEYLIRIKMSKFDESQV
jgi:hypothetical protein